MHSKPKISINKLVEFMEALPSRQREIVDNQKNPQANKPKMTWCSRARKAIIQFFADGCASEAALDEEIERLQAEIEGLDEKDPKKLESKTSKLQVEIDAINSFKGLQTKIGLKKAIFSKVSKKPKYLDIAGVNISVRPEIAILTRRWKHIGCLKLYFTKNTRLSQTEADLLCSALHEYVCVHLSPDRSAIPMACIAIDVFGQKVFSATRKISVYSKKLRDCCQDISEIWREVPIRDEIGGGNDEQQPDLI
jgi:hypothetical protein